MCATTATSRRSVPDTLVLYGSPHQNGDTARLLKIYLREIGGEAMIVDCFAHAVSPCDDCRGCYQAPRCVKRDMEDIYDALETAQRLIVATPVYHRSFPAPLKAVLDRLQCYWAARFIRGERPPIKVAKSVALLTTCGSGREDGVYLEAQLAPHLTVLNATLCDTLHLRGGDDKVDWTAVERELQSRITLKPDR